MTPTAVRDRAVTLLERAASAARPCCARALATAADDVQAIAVPSPEEGARARSRVILALETCARLLRRGESGRAVAGRMGGIVQQIRRLVVVGVEPIGRRPDTVPPPDEQPEGDVETSPEPAVMRGKTKGVV
jgi:hypothetical protein